MFLGFNRAGQAIITMNGFKYLVVTDCPWKKTVKLLKAGKV